MTQQHYALFSDVHAIHPALITVLGELEALSTPHTPIFLGDVIGYGTQPRPTALELYEYLQSKPGSVALMGNHDALALGLSSFNAGNEKQTAMEQLAKQHYASLTQESDFLTWFQSLPPQIAFPNAENPLMFLAHDEYISQPPSLAARSWGYATKSTAAAREQTRILTNVSARILVVGHRHVPYVARYESRRRVQEFDPWKTPLRFENLTQFPIIINVGSIAIPRQNARAAYVLLTINEEEDWAEITFHEVRYDWKPLLKSFQEMTYPAALRQQVIGQIKGVRQNGDSAHPTQGKMQE